MSKLANLMIGLVLFSMVILGANLFLGGFTQHYNIQIEEGWADVYDFTGNISFIGTNMTGTLQTKSTSWLEHGLRMGYSVLRMTLGIPKYIYSLFGNVMARLHLPPELVNPIVAIMVLILIFIIAAALVRWYL